MPQSFFTAYVMVRDCTLAILIDAGVWCESASAMLSRAERATLLNSTPTNFQNELVGPGSYAVQDPHNSQTRGPSSAFAWSGKRSTLPTAPPPAADEDPESPHEQAHAHIRPWTTNTTSSSFASSTKRFTLDKESVAKPGPGAYQTRSSWAQQQQSPHAASSRKGHMLSAALIGCPVRVPDPAASAAAAARKGPSTHAELLLSTPPSIPARHQSYGYEPGPGNSLVMQPPPAPAAADSTGSAGKAAASSPSTISNSSRLKSPGRPSTVPNSRGGSGAGTAAAGGRSSSARSPLREPTRQLQQQLQAVQQPSPVLQQLAGSVSPRFRCAAGGKLVLSKGSQRAGSAAFASKSARPHQQEPDPEKMTPGPGAYSSSSSGSARPLSAPLFGSPTSPSLAGSPRCRQQQPLFARTAGRSAALSVGPGWSLPPSKSVSPGPGTYNLGGPMTVPVAAAAAGGSPSLDRPLGGVRAAGRVWGRSALVAGVAAAAGGEEASVREDEAAAAAGFGCTSRRFGNNKTVAPGPGKYTTYQLLSMSAEAAKRAAAASRRGAFGTAVSSGRSLSVVDQALGFGSSGSGPHVPGPGCYDVRVGLADSVAAAAVRPSAGFVSASERFTPAAAPIAAPDFNTFDGSTMRGDQTRLGPGTYLKLNDWRHGGEGASWHGGYHSAPFGSESGRRGLAAGAQDAPGPGAYAAVDVAKVFQPLSMPGKAGFATTSQRFKLKGPTPETVGPGTYVTQGSLVRPTFNVTLDQP